MLVKVDRHAHAPEPSSWTSQNRHLALLSPNFTYFLSEVWFFSGWTLYRGIESWDSVGDQSCLVSLLTCITMTVQPPGEQVFICSVMALRQVKATAL